jgi:enoyl-CoA hydratase/carnithine racemase
MVDQPPLLARSAPHIAEIRLRRPAVANRIEPNDLTLLMRYLQEVEADPAVHVLVLSAEGKVFSAGFHLGALTTRQEMSGTKRENHFEQFTNQLAALPKITIAAINGAVVGGSTDIALACDLRIGANTASMMMPAGRIGLPLYASALSRYVSRLGVDVAKRLILLGEKIPAAEMLMIGFLSEVVEDNQLDARVAELAADIAALPSAPIRAMKAVLNATAAGADVSLSLRENLDAAFDSHEIARRVAARSAARAVKQT